MRLELDWRSAAAFAAAAALLLLSGPGVRAVRAEEPPPAALASEPGPSCEPASPITVLPIDDLVEKARQRRAPGLVPDDQVVVLNNRGFNYGARPAPEPPPALQQP